MTTPTRLAIYRILKEAGPMTVDEIHANLPHTSRRALQARLSELTQDEYPGMIIRRVYRGVYRAI